MGKIFTIHSTYPDRQIFTRGKFHQFLDCDCTTSTFPSLVFGKDYILERDLEFLFGSDTLQIYLGFLFALSTHRNKLLHWVRVDEQYHCSTPVYFAEGVLFLCAFRHSEEEFFPSTPHLVEVTLRGFTGRQESNTKPKHFVRGSSSIYLTEETFYKYVKSTCPSQDQDNFQFSLFNLASMATLKNCPHRESWKRIPRKTGVERMEWHRLFIPIYLAVGGARTCGECTFVFKT